MLRGRLAGDGGGGAGRLVGDGGIGDYATAHGVDGGAGGRGQVTRAGGAFGGGVRGSRGDLVQQVDELLDGADEVAGGEVGRLGQDALQPSAAGPPVGRPGKAEVGLAQERQVVVLLQLVELAPGAG